MSDDLQELLKIAENTAKLNVADYEANEVQTFVRFNNIKPGSKKIPGHIIYTHYRAWANDKKCITRNSFFMKFNKIIAPKRLGIGRVYELDPTPFGLPEDYSIYTDPVVVTKKVAVRSEYTGVYRAGKRGYVAILKIGDKRMALGSSREERMAAEIYDRGAIRHLGENHGSLNFPERKPEYVKDLEKTARKQK